MDELLRLLGTFGVTVVILLLAYFCTRLLGGRDAASRRGGAGARRLRIVERLSVGKEQRLIIVQLHERYLLIGVSAGSFTTLAELTEEEAALWRESQARERQTPSFKEALLASLHKEKK